MIRRILLLPTLVVAAFAQENMELGRMWTFENPPLDYLQQEYGFRPTQAWLDAVRLASLRFGDGCSASFVSPHGLIMTNHHCVRDDIANNQGEADWVADGFVAKRIEDEVELRGLSVQQLVEIRDVTAEINRGIADGATAAEIARQRADNQRRVMDEAMKARPDLRPEIVVLFQGASYQLYSYKIYDDIRLVVAPHLQASHFGGDPDNFTYPRFGIDFAFCRAYENGEPADTAANYFRWRAAGPKRGELVFVTGNPGTTSRLQTKAQFEYARDASHPRIRQLIDNRLEIMRGFASGDAAAEKELRTTILSYENAQKAYRGMHEGLLDPDFMARKETAERSFRERVERDPELKRKFGHVWTELAEVAAARTALEGPLAFHGAGGSTHLLRALAVLAAVEDGTGPDAALAIPIGMGPQQTAFFVDHLERARAWLPNDDPFLTAVLGTRPPKLAAAHLEEASRIGDDELVKQLVGGGTAAIDASTDPAIVVARTLRPLAQANQAKNQELDDREEQLGTEIGLALFGAYGTAVTPDATFTLRFSDGVVKGYEYNGTIAPYRTTFYGMYARNAEFDDVYPFNLPRVWHERIDQIDMSKAVNFVCTVDSTGGNSGSPVISADREIVGLLFDGNIESLPNDFIFSDEIARSVCVHTEGITEALIKIYETRRIVSELTR